MTLTELLALVASSGANIRIRSDSRRVEKGDCMVALVGIDIDGHDFIDDALDRGAAYIVCEKRHNCRDAEMILVKNSHKALGLLAQSSFSNPSAKLTNLAVTGTNGKTTVGFLVRSIIGTAGKKCGLLGTIVYDTGDESANASLTTPDSLDIAELASKMVDAGAEFMMIEASSHALSQDRLAGINFAAAAFTNLTGDHLDYHHTMEDYLAAKKKLFSNMPSKSVAVINQQSTVRDEIIESTKAKILLYTADDPTGFLGDNIGLAADIESMDARQTVYTLRYHGSSEQVTTSLIGIHNVSNQLAAAGLCIVAGFDLPTIAAGIRELKVVPGRLEAVDCGQNFSVFVDYAHTDDALENVLNTLRPLCKGSVIVVFGAGGNRDRTKRPRMAKIAETLADRIIVTSDNPRTEEPMNIIKDITAGFSRGDSAQIIVEPDRKKAIKLAINFANPGDIVLIAGKGHETYQIIGNKKYDFDDRLIAENVLREIK